MSEAPSTRRPARDGRILLIDDDALFARGLARLLRGDGYTVEVAENGRVGLERMAAAPSDLVITDVVMPEKEGVETAQELKRAYPGVPVIAISGAMSGAAYLQALRMLGADDTLQKPFSHEDLLAAIDRARG